MIKRLGFCEEVNAKCPKEAKCICDECKLTLCFNHSDGHEKHTCPKLNLTKDEVKDVFSDVGEFNKSLGEEVRKELK